MTKEREREWWKSCILKYELIVSDIKKKQPQNWTVLQNYTSKFGTGQRTVYIENNIGYTLYALKRKEKHSKIGLGIKFF